MVNRIKDQMKKLNKAYQEKKENLNDSRQLF